MILIRRSLALFLLFVAGAAMAQFSAFHTWEGKLSNSDVRAGETTYAIATATIDPGWNIYSTNVGDAGPTPTSFEVKSGPAELAGDVVEQKHESKLDPNFNVVVGLHRDKASFAIPIKIQDDASGEVTVVIAARAQACDPTKCALPATQDITLTFNVSPGEARGATPELPSDIEWASAPAGDFSGGAADGTAAGAATDNEFGTAVTKARQAGIAPFLWFAFTAGLLALLTPCVFPMIPITVSYFSKQTEKGANRFVGPLAYSGGIIGTFTLLGILTTVIFGASGINRLATNPFLNFALAALFVVLALNLFGMFEIKLPTGLVNRFGGNRGGNGIVPAILMGLTFTLTSFTCTVPFVGTILVTASQGDIFYPLIGMLAFSTAFAIPFFLLAMFPQWLAKMPKSGGWLGSVKAYMGFLELAAAVKFLSNVDLVWMLGWITRPVFLSIWSTIAVVAGMYMLGWLKLPFDHGETKIGKVRYGVGLATLGCSIYLLGAIQGAPMGVMSAFLPPDPYPGQKSGSVMERLSWHDTLDEAKTQAAAEQKLVFMDFTGVTCTNCRQMEQIVFPAPEVEKELEKFARAKLYTDRPTEADTANANLMVKLTNATTLPVYVVAKPDGTPISIFQGSTFDTGAFAKFLREAQDKASQ